MLGSKWRRSAILWLAQRAKPSMKYLRTFVFSAEKGGSEPMLPNAAMFSNVGAFVVGSKTRSKIEVPQSERLMHVRVFRNRRHPSGAKNA